MPRTPAGDRRHGCSATTRIVGGRRVDVAGLWRDLVAGLGHREVWMAFAWDEIQNRYRRSVLGLAWLAISFLLFVGAIALFFGDFARMGSASFVVYVSFGFAIFNFLMANVVDGCSVFTTSAGWVRSSSLPYAIYVFKGVARALFPAGIQLSLACVVAAFSGWTPQPSALLALPGLALAILTAVPVQYTLGLLAARLRDVGHLVQAVSRLLFFTTPILWVYEETSGMRRKIADLNPFTHFVEMIRDPLMGTAVDPAQWLISGLWCAGAWGLLLIVGGTMRRKLPFWV